MKRLMLAALFVAAPALAQQATTAPGHAQISTTPALPGIPKPKPVSAPGQVSRSAPVNGVLTLFGNERCPTNSAGEEIVVCVRRGAEEQYRVPKELREFQITPQNESWAAHAQGVMDTGVGVSSIGSCSAVGAGGATGCFAQQARQAKRESNARKADEASIP